jgi:hypothetical protein
LSAYAKDVAGGADMTARALASRNIDPLALPNYEEDEPSSSSKKSTTGGAWSEVATKDQSLWVEAVSEEGDTYYWNIKTQGSYFFF